MSSSIADQIPQPGMELKADGPSSDSAWSAGPWWTLVKESVSAWLSDYAPSVGAALSYHTVFSLAPLLLIVVSRPASSSGQRLCAGKCLRRSPG